MKASGVEPEVGAGAFVTVAAAELAARLANDAGTGAWLTVVGVETTGATGSAEGEGATKGFRTGTLVVGRVEKKPEEPDAR